MSAEVRAWVVLDAEDNTVLVERHRAVALDHAERIDGSRVAPLIMTDLDDVTSGGPEPAAVALRDKRFAVALLTVVGNLMWPEAGMATEAEAEAYAARHNARPTRHAIVVEFLDGVR